MHQSQIAFRICTRIATTQTLQTVKNPFNCLTDSNRRSTSTLISLRSHNLVIIRPHAHTQRLPSSKMVGSRHRTRSPLRASYTPILLECSSALDRRLVGPCCLEDIVDGAIAGDCAFECSSARGVVGAVGLDDVVFDEWRGGPAVDGEVAVADGAEGAGVCDCSSMCQ